MNSSVHVSANFRSWASLLIAPVAYGAAMWLTIGSLSHDLPSDSVSAPPAATVEFENSVDASSILVSGEQPSEVSSHTAAVAIGSFLGATLLVTGFSSVMLLRMNRVYASVVTRSEAYSRRVQQFSSEMATVAQQTSASIEEIARSSQSSVASLEDALRHAEHSSEVVKSLGQQTDSVTGLVREITAISEQTNLLALNATIESARAGEAGKGFSIVANEVKQLANSARMTSQRVIDRVRCIQQFSGETISTTADVLSLMKQCAESQTTIASAVEEQRTIASQLARQANDLANEAGRESESDSHWNAAASFPCEMPSEEIQNHHNLPMDTTRPARRRSLQSVSHSFTP